MGALQAFSEEITDACVIEAYAAIRVLTFSQEMGFRDILLEGDVLTVINKVTQTCFTLSTIGNLIEDMKNLKYFRSCKAQYVRRTANESTYLLAKNALMIDEELVYVENCPAFNFLLLFAIVILLLCNEFSLS